MQKDKQKFFIFSTSLDHLDNMRKQKNFNAKT